MASNAYQFLSDNLLPENLFCYIARLLDLYSKLQVGTPTIHPGMEPVVPEIPHDCSSVCQKVNHTTQIQTAALAHFNSYRLRTSIRKRKNSDFNDMILE